MTLKHSTSLLAERPSWMEIDLDALAHNYAAIRALVGPDIDIMPALKGDAYGHGAALVAAELACHDVKFLALGSAADAHSVRDNQVKGLASHWNTNPLHALMSFSGRIPRVAIGGLGKKP